MKPPAQAVPRVPPLGDDGAQCSPATRRAESLPINDPTSFPWAILAPTDPNLRLLTLSRHRNR
jgi:hypothetical protein